MIPGDLAISVLKGPTPLWGSSAVGDFSTTGELMPDSWCLALAVSQREEWATDIWFVLVVTGEGTVGWINNEFLQETPP